MPIYLYECPTCGHSLEDVRAVALRDVLPDCGTCQLPMTRQHTPTSFRIKGYSSVNGYSRTDTGWIKQGNGIRTRVSDAPDKER